MPELALGRQCCSEDCEEHIHHACFTKFCHDHGIEDPESNQAFCVSCAEELYPEAVQQEVDLAEAGREFEEAEAAGEFAEAEAETETEAQDQQEAVDDAASAAGSEEEGAAAANAEGGLMETEEQPAETAITMKPPAEQVHAASDDEGDDDNDDDKSVTSTRDSEAETQGFFGGSLPPTVDSRVLLPQGKGAVFAVEGTVALVGLDKFQWDKVDVSKLAAWGQTAGQLEVDFSAPTDTPEVHAVLLHNRQGKPEAYLTGPSTRPNGTEWRLFAAYGPAPPNAERHSEPALTEALEMGMHVKYECPGAVPIMSGNPLPPAEGDAHLVAIAISKKQGAQGRRFALLMPNDEKDSMFFVGLDGSLTRGDCKQVPFPHPHPPHNAPKCLDLCHCSHHHP